MIPRGLLRPHRIGFGAGGNIHGHHGDLTRIQKCNGRSVEPADRRLKASPKNRVEIQVGERGEAHAFTVEVFARSNDRRGQRQLAEHHRRVAPQIGRIGEQNHLNRLPRPMQPPRSHKSIAAVVSLAAKYHDLLRRTEMRQDMLRHSRTSILHQRERRHAIALVASAINGPHFVSRNNFHAAHDYKTKRPSAPRGGPL